MRYDSNTIYRFKLIGHAFTRFPSAEEPIVRGTITEDPDNKDFYRCTVNEPIQEEYPSAWAGVYRVSKAAAAELGLVIPE